MTIAECYSKFGGDYQDVLGRLGRDERILKYLNMFSSGNDCELLATSLAAGNFEEAFRNVHNLKGIASNLSLTPIFAASNTLCEAIRHGKPDFDISDMMTDVQEAYDIVISAIREL